MDYGAIAWYKLPRHKTLQLLRSLSKLETAQKLAMKAILETFQTIATSALQIKTALLPIHLWLTNKVLQSWTRMRIAPEIYRIKAPIQQVNISQSKIHITSLEYLARTFPKYAISVETIKAYLMPLWLSPPFTIEIDTNKKTAKAKHNTAYHKATTLCIYIDGLEINEHVGSAAFCPKISKIIQ